MFFEQKKISANIKNIKNEFRFKREINIRVMLNKKRHNIFKIFDDIDFRRNHDMNRKLRHFNTNV